MRFATTGIDRCTTIVAAQAEFRISAEHQKETAASDSLVYLHHRGQRQTYFISEPSGGSETVQNLLRAQRLELLRKWQSARMAV
jgi:hypothetical protein